MSKKPNHWFYLYKKCTIKTCIFIQKRQVSFVKKPYHYQWFNLLLLKPTPPQKLLYKPRLFYSNHPIHCNIELWTTSTTWTPAGLSSPGPSSPPIRSSTVVESHHNLKSEDPQEARRHHWGYHRWGQDTNQRRRSSLEGCCHQRSFVTTSNSSGRTSQRIGCSETRRSDISC